VASKKTVFVAFAIEDERQRDFLKGQSLNTACPFGYIDMSVKEAYESDWKTKVQTRIRRSDGVIALVSKHSLASSGQKWEITCALAEEKKECLASGPTKTTKPVCRTSELTVGRGTASPHLLTACNNLPCARL
jgi:Fe-S-cluster-containing hydrogenase component 2